MQVLLVQDSWAGDCLCEERVGSAELAVFGDAALVQECGRRRGLELITGLDVDLLLKGVLGRDLLANLILQVTQLLLLILDLPSELLAPLLHLSGGILGRMKFVEHRPKFGKNIQSLLRGGTIAMDG